MYHHLSHHYDRIFPENTVLKNLILSYAKGGRALDLGCGTGRMANALYENYDDVIGVDLDLGMIEVAAKRYPHVTWVQADMVAFLETSMPFDTILCLGNTLPHLDVYRLNQLVEKIARKLKPDGHFFIQLLNYDSIMSDKPRFLKTIETADCVFVREYRYQPHWIDFTTYLIGDGTVQKETNRIHPYRKKDLEIILESHHLHYEFMETSNPSNTHYIIHVTHEQKEG